MVEVHSKPSGHSMKTGQKRSSVNKFAHIIGISIKIKNTYGIQLKNCFL